MPIKLATGRGSKKSAPPVIDMPAEEVMMAAFALVLERRFLTRLEMMKNMLAPRPRQTPARVSDS